MATKTVLPAAVLALRLLTLALLAASLAVIAADKLTIDLGDGEAPQRYTFKDVHAYRYLLAVAVIGCAYTLLQLLVAAVSVARGKRAIGGGTKGVALLLVCADVVFALLLATGAAAGLGFTYDVMHVVDPSSAPDSKLHRDLDRFFMMANASAGLMLVAAACVALMVMLSVYGLVM
ncbi:hypothetical protein ACP4OV_027208 [Aristida adscensionis]